MHSNKRAIPVHGRGRATAIAAAAAGLALLLTACSDTSEDSTALPSGTPTGAQEASSSGAPEASAAPSSGASPGSDTGTAPSPGPSGEAIIDTSDAPMPLCISPDSSVDGVGASVFIYATISDPQGKEVWNSGEPVKVASDGRLIWSKTTGPNGKPIILPGGRYNLALFISQLEPTTDSPRFATGILISNQLNSYFGYGDNCKKADPQTSDPSASPSTPQAPDQSAAPATTPSGAVANTPSGAPAVAPAP